MGSTLEAVLVLVFIFSLVWLIIAVIKRKTRFAALITAVLSLILFTKVNNRPPQPDNEETSLQPALTNEPPQEIVIIPKFVFLNCDWGQSIQNTLRILSSSSELSRLEMKWLQNITESKEESIGMKNYQTRTLFSFDFGGHKWNRLLITLMDNKLKRIGLVAINIDSNQVTNDIAAKYGKGTTFFGSLKWDAQDGSKLMLTVSPTKEGSVATYVEFSAPYFHEEISKKEDEYKNRQKSDQEKAKQKW